MYEIRLLEEATRELGRLDRTIGRRIVLRLQWLAANVDDLKPESLSGKLAGFFKLRVGDYRVLYEVLHAEHVIVVHMIGHRSEIYRE